MWHLDPVASPAVRFPDRVAVAAGTESLTYREVEDRVDRLGAVLQDLGLRPGDRVALLAENEPEYVEIQTACLRYGFALVPLNSRLTTPEVRFILHDCSPRALLLGRRFRERAPDFGDLVDPIGTFALGRGAGSLTYETALAEARRPVEGPIDPGLVCTILYTSGTTGPQKGAMVDRTGFSARVLSNAVELGIRATDVHLAVLPMFHIAAFLAYAHVANGATVVMLPEFTPETVLHEIEARSVTTATLVPTIISMLTEQPGFDEHNLTSLRLVVYGGSPIAPDPLRRALQAFDCGFLQQFGLTETGGVTIMRPEDHDPDDPEALTTAGQLAVGAQVVILNESDRPVGAGEVGEICCRSQALFKGYWNREEETRASLRGGWFHTGDLGFLDERGMLHVTGRRNDTIVTGGENVHPREVETVLLEHPRVSDVAVVGTSDPRWGELVTAVVVGDMGDMADEDLATWARARLAGYKVPRRWVHVEDLPRNATGKVLRHVLRQELSDGPRLEATPVP